MSSFSHDVSKTFQWWIVVGVARNLIILVDRILSNKTLRVCVFVVHRRKKTFLLTLMEKELKFRIRALVRATSYEGVVELAPAADLGVSMST